MEEATTGWVYYPAFLTVIFASAFARMKSANILRNDNSKRRGSLAASPKGPDAKLRALLKVSMAAEPPNCEAKEKNMQTQVLKLGGWLLQALSRPELGGAHFSLGSAMPLFTDSSWQEGGNWASAG